jgi:hypothetical protein
LTDLSEVSTASIIRAMMMEAVRTSETSVNFNVTTWRYIPEDSKLPTEARLYTCKTIDILHVINFSNVAVFSPVPITRVPVTALNFRPENIPFEYLTGYNLSQGFR